MELPAEVYELSVANAQLPAAYENAKLALSECNNIDECQDWADKMAALASYAKQADDETLEKLSMRIRARAIRRAGELLKQFDGRSSNALKQKDDTDPLLSSRKEIGQNAGMSERQIKTASRVANIPDQQFEKAIESDNPPTITFLSEQGKKKMTDSEQAAYDFLTKEKPDGFNEAIHLMGALRRLFDKMQETDPLIIINGMDARQKNEARQKIEVMEKWIDKFIVNLK